MRLLVALGGNAMTAPDGSATPQAQIAAVTAAAGGLAALVADGHELVLTHGNGPQVGNLLVKNELAAHVVPPVPLDWCGAQTQGTVGAVVLDALEPALAAHGLAPRVAVLVSRTLVDRDDPGLHAPSKPVGRYLPADEARALVEHGQVWQDRGERGWRRVVASPEPVEVLDAPAARVLLEAGYVVVVAGGGGIPTVREPDGRLRGVEAVIDKDLTAAVLARQLGADALVIATDVPAAVLGHGTPDARPLGRVTTADLRAHAAGGAFASGSMGPKVEAALRFVEAGGALAAITALGAIGDAVRGRAGTVVVP
ncbi:carbamate kinase [Vallicoccus soli]|uniref:Carbamate kinase n=1 Tax=Vallicoccus soli TaxID=2339232 RepID=A0A3A3ZKY6_9ACTN|nr:carbamate kinase [Vallicoccus soli]RJK96712.1 carbamate kinase [Vallicoccus soli]